MANEMETEGESSAVDGSLEGTLALEGTLGTQEPPPSDRDGGFDFLLFAILALVAGLVAIQNVWLRRRAQRENTEGDVEGPPQKPG